MATFNDVRQILRRWDKGSQSVRESMLRDILLQCSNMTAPELEIQFCDCASLFLARLTAWLRLTYMVGTCLELQLKTISLFVGATSGQYFLSEFLGVGGVLTVLEVVGLRGAREGCKAEALRLLTSIASKGRQYKELLCESYGVKLVAECLALSSSPDTQESARLMFLQLSTIIHDVVANWVSALLFLPCGNPRYQSQVYKALIALLSSTSSEAQRIAAHTLRQIQSSMGVVSASIVEPSLQLLRSLHVDVQHEASELLQDLASYEEVQQPLLVGLVGMLKTSEEDSATKSATEPEGKIQAPLPINIQQAGAAKVIGTLAKRSTELAERLIELTVVLHLLYAMGNTSHVDSQRQAAITLAGFVQDYASVKEQVESILGEEFFRRFTAAPEKLYLALSPPQVDVLVACLGQDIEVT